MSDHIVHSFDEEMRALGRGLIDMGERAAVQLRRAIDALDKRDLALAARVREADAEIDTLYEATEERVINILALRNPVAVDLRETVSAMQMAREFERIGDYAKNIAKRVAGVLDRAPGPIDRAISAMGAATVAHLEDVVRAYQSRDAELSLAVWKADEAIDEYCNTIFADILKSMASGGDVAANAHLLFVAKNLERIGDHATNVAESVRFILTGEKFRESRPKSDKTSYAAAR